MKTGPVEREQLLLDLLWYSEIELDDSFFILI